MMEGESKFYSDGMSTEMLMRSVFGDKYHGSASSYQNPKYFKKDISKLLNTLSAKVDKLIASENFKNYCSRELKKMAVSIKSANSEDDYRKLLVDSLNVSTSLLGYNYVSKGVEVEPYFIPSVWAEVISEHKKDLSKVNDDVYSKRIKAVQFLLQDGCTYAEIAEIMQMSKHQASQIIKKAKEPLADANASDDIKGGGK